MYNYPTITLVSRNINCSNITENDFVKAMFSDFLEAQEKYDDLYIPEWEAWKVKNFFDKIKWTTNWAKKQAEKRWKTEKKRNAFIAQEVEKVRNEWAPDNFYYSLSFFDFKVNPGEMGIPGDCVISYRDLTPEKLIKCFNKVKDNKYFKKAIGWKLTYKADGDSYRSAFRPQIKLIVDPETEAQMKKDAEDLATSVNNFYKNCHYWGD